MKCDCFPMSKYEFEEGKVKHKICLTCGLHYELWYEDEVKMGKSSFIPMHRLRQMEENDPEQHIPAMFERRYLQKLYSSIK